MWESRIKVNNVVDFNCLGRYSWIDARQQIWLPWSHFCIKRTFLLIVFKVLHFLIILALSDQRWRNKEKIIHITPPYPSYEIYEGYGYVCEPISPFPCYIRYQIHGIISYFGNLVNMENNWGKSFPWYLKFYLWKEKPGQLDWKLIESEIDFFSGI